MKETITLAPGFTNQRGVLDSGHYIQWKLHTADIMTLYTVDTLKWLFLYYTARDVVFLWQGKGIVYIS